MQMGDDRAMQADKSLGLNIPLSRSFSWRSQNWNDSRRINIRLMPSYCQNIDDLGFEEKLPTQPTTVGYVYCQ